MNSPTFKATHRDLGAEDLVYNTVDKGVWIKLWLKAVGEPTALADENPIPQLPHIDFDEASHKYTVAGRVIPISSTGLVHSAFGPGFDEKGMSARIAFGSRWKREPEFSSTGRREKPAIC